MKYKNIVNFCAVLYHHFLSFLGMFTELLKATISFVMSFHLSAWSSAPTEWIVMKFEI